MWAIIHRLKKKFGIEYLRLLRGEEGELLSII